MENLKFRIPAIPYVAVIILITSPLLIFGINFPDMLWLWVIFTFPYIIYSLYIGVMEIGPEGIRLYRINMLRWNDVKSARKKRYLGLRYLLVKRQKGMNYWVPLYFTGDTPIEAALQKNVPPKNPIASCL